MIDARWIPTAGPGSTPAGAPGPTLHRSARIAAIVILDGQDRPALMFLRLDKRRAGLTLGVERIEGLIQAFVS